MNIKYCYKLYNLVLASELPLDILPQTSSRHIDVKLTLGACPIDVSISSKQFLLNRPEVARFYIENGRNIIVEPVSGVDQQLLYTYILGSVFGIILHQRGFLVLHGNAVIDSDNKAILFVTHSGGGKSTLSAALWKAGFDILSDDVTPIFFDKYNHPWVLPAYGQVKLWQDTIDALQINKHCKKPVSKRHNKFYIALPGMKIQHPVRLKSVYILEHGPKFVVKKCIGAQSLLALIENTYRFQFLTKMQLNAQHFHLCKQLLKTIQIATFVRPMSDFKNQEVIDWLR